MAGLDEYTQGVMSKLKLDVRNTPAISPALLAYLRGIGMTLGTAEDNRARQRGDVERDYQRNTEDVERSADASKRNLTGSLISRGVLRSGDANRRYGEQGQERSRRLNDVSTNRADRLGAVDRAYFGVEDSLRQNTTERLMGAEQDEANRRAVEEAEKRQNEQLIAFYNKQAGGKK